MTDASLIVDALRKLEEACEKVAVTLPEDSMELRVLDTARANARLLIATTEADWDIAPEKFEEWWENNQWRERPALNYTDRKIIAWAGFWAAWQFFVNRVTTLDV